MKKNNSTLLRGMHRIFLRWFADHLPMPNSDTSYFLQDHRSGTVSNKLSRFYAPADGDLLPAGRNLRCRSS